MIKDKILQFFSKLPELELTRVFMDYQIRTLNDMFPAVTAAAPTTTQKPRRAKRSKRKAATTTGNHIEDKNPSMADLIGKALTDTPMRPVEVANKLYQSKLIPSLDTKIKQRVGMELIRLAKLGRVAKDGKSYKTV